MCGALLLLVVHRTNRKKKREEKGGEKKEGRHNIGSTPGSVLLIYSLVFSRFGVDVFYVKVFYSSY